MELEKKFAELAQEIYESGERRITPTWPWVLIRVVPKEQKIGSIWAPDIAGSKMQNKPLWEGIVLATWGERWTEFKGSLEETDVLVNVVKLQRSEFQPGDRILFPGWAGLPVSFLDETKYRLVREWTFDPDGGVMCKVHYEGDKRYKETLDELFSDLQSVTLSGE